MDNLLQQITKWAEEKMEGTDLFIVSTKSNNDGSKLNIFVDGDEGVNINKVSEISRYISHMVDENITSEKKFVFEISSPGVDAPLLLLRQYPKHVGRKLKIELKDGGEVKGELSAIDGDELTILSEEKVKVGKKKKMETIEEKINFNNINEAKVLISFK